MLTNPQIEKYQFLYQKNFGEQISKEDAVYQGERLIELIKNIYQINIKQNGKSESKTIINSKDINQR